MAGLGAGTSAGAGSGRAARLRGQFGALAFLRWRLFVNGFGKKPSVGEWTARLVLYPLLAILVLIPVMASALTAYAAVAHGPASLLGVVCWSLFGLSVTLSLQLSRPALPFDPASLIRYPLSFAAYLATRLFLGLLSASNVVSSLSLAAAVVGVGLARPALFPIAVLAFGLFALSLMLFTRMVFAWVDRWLATRRARDLLTGTVFAFALSTQFFNFYLIGDATHLRSLAQLAARFHLTGLLLIAQHLVSQVQALSVFLPPGLAASAVTHGLHSGSTVAAELAPLAGIISFGAVFLAIFALRMRKEFRGENLGEGVPVSRETTPAQRVPRTGAAPAASVSMAAPAPAPSNSQVIAACLQKELTYLRRSGPLVFVLLSPLVMVYFFANRWGDSPTTAAWIFPSAVAYSLLGISAGSYNCLGPDLAGLQMYLLAPVRLHLVMLAKNLITFITLGLQVVLTCAIVTVAGHPPSLPVGLATLLWFVFAVSINTSLGNRRSITAPKRVELGKTGGKQASALSSFMGAGVLLLCAGVGAGVLFLGSYFDSPWLPAEVFALLAGAGVAIYLAALARLDATAMRHRETLTAILCRI